MAEELVIAASRGVISAPIQAGGNALSDSTQTWRDGIFRNFLVRITAPDGHRELAIVDNNGSQALIIRGSWLKSYPSGSVYEILALGDLRQALRDVFGGGLDISATNPLQVLDPKVSGQIARPLISLYEGWQDELGIDATVWTVTNPATGAAWEREQVNEDLMAYSSPNANENARIRSVQRWVSAPTLYGVNKVLRRLTLEFELQLVNLANFDNANFFLGLTSGVDDTKGTNNIIGFALVGAGNALQTLTDNGGVETVNTGFGENLANKNKLKVEIYLNHIKFYLNETQIADHAANLPNAPFYLNFYAPTGAGGAATIRLGIIRCWPEDIP